MGNLNEIKHRHDRDRWKDAIFILAAVLLTALPLTLLASLVPQLHGLIDAGREEGIAHHDPGALLLRIRAEAALEVADAGGLDGEAVAPFRYEFAAARVVEIDRDHVARVA